MKSQESMNSHRSFPWLAWGPFAVLLSSTHGCGGGGGSPEGGTTPASPASKTESEKPRIALIMKSLANEFFKTMAEIAGQRIIGPKWTWVMEAGRILRPRP
jgi:hypothetical protein